MSESNEVKNNPPAEKPASPLAKLLGGKGKGKPAGKPVPPPAKPVAKAGKGKTASVASKPAKGKESAKGAKETGKGKKAPSLTLAEKVKQSLDRIKEESKDALEYCGSWSARAHREYGIQCSSSDRFALYLRPLSDASDCWDNCRPVVATAERPKLTELPPAPKGFRYSLCGITPSKDSKGE